MSEDLMCSYRGEIEGVSPDRVKPIRVRCPVCGRRMMSQVVVRLGDRVHKMPPHKKKEWYKKKVRVQTKEAARTRKRI